MESEEKGIFIIKAVDYRLRTGDKQVLESSFQRIWTILWSKIVRPSRAGLVPVKV